MDNRLYDNIPLKQEKIRVITYCDHCGFAVYSTDDALMINGSGDIIHADCWEEYSSEHMFDFSKKITDTDCFCRTD